MTDVRSAEAPDTTTYRLSLPTGATLKEGHDGVLEVTEGETPLMEIPTPTALDAAGNGVPVEMAIQGEDDIEVTVAPTGEAAYPILVDPEWAEYYDWAWGPESVFNGWTGSTTAPMNPAGYHTIEPVGWALWDNALNGPDLTSGFEGWAVSGMQANWEYWVPRYRQELAAGREAPTSSVYEWYMKGITFLPYGNNAKWPALVVGLVEPGVGWTQDYVHTGEDGEMYNWNNELSIAGLVYAQKGADMNLVTYENEVQTKHRDTYIAYSEVYVIDVDSPRFTELVAPTKWMNTTPEPIHYAFEDTGLGAKMVRIGFNGNFLSGWGMYLPCIGNVHSPCQRWVNSSTPEAALVYHPSELPTGEDTVTVTASDPVFNQTAENVVLKVDHTPPEVTLSGQLTEQEHLGTRGSEYPLKIKAIDGTETLPQSGVAKVEVKVDGTTKQTWNPGCTTKNCSFTGNWTLKTSEYSAASHEVEVLVTDAVGNVSEHTIDVDLGEAPPQTSFTSAHPSYEAGELSTISFKATRGGAPVAAAEFLCSLDEDEANMKPCKSPFTLPKPLGAEGEHTFLVAAVDPGGTVDPTPARWSFETAAYPAAPSPSEKLVYPESGGTSASEYTLEAEWGNDPEGKAAEGVTGVTFQMELPGWTNFKPVPEQCTIDGEGHQVSWPLRSLSHPGHNAPVYFRARGCPIFESEKYPEAEIEFRAVFDGGSQVKGSKVAGSTAPVSTEFVYDDNTTRVSSDAVEEVGPASVDLLTGGFTLSHTDVSIPDPGYEANLEFTRVYRSSADGRVASATPTKTPTGNERPEASQVLGGAWQPSSPLEMEGEAEAWVRIEEKEIPYHPKKWGYACFKEEEVEVGEEEIEERWSEVSCPGNVAENCPEETCEKYLEEEEQQQIRWIELFDNEEAAVPFEIVGSGTSEKFVAPHWAQELELYKEKESGYFVLAYPNGTHTTFVRGAGATAWKPEYISYQATPGSMRLVYKTHENAPGKKELRLEREVAPSQVTCPEWATTPVPGCRMLVLVYAPYTPKGGATLILLSGIFYWGPMGPGDEHLVANYGYEDHGTPSGTPGAALSWEKEPRTGLEEKYTYESSPHGNELSSMRPPGQEPWIFEYEKNAPGVPKQGEKPTRLKSVSRGGAKTTIAYEVPVEGAGAPYEMSAERVATWGQSDLPVDATAIFPPEHVPYGSPPSSYTGATIRYLDAEGHQVNVLAPSPPGVSGASITTTETDMKGNVVRELSAQDRLTALESKEPVAESHLLDTHSIYNAAGTEMLESWGPLHEVRLESGEAVQARRHTVTHYDQEEPRPPTGTPPADLPTKETVSAVVPGREGELEPRVTETHYDWTFRLPEETVVDPTGLDIRTVTKYNAAGQVIETRQPKGVAGEGAGDTRTIYYSAGAGTPGCEEVPQTANLPCEVLPAKQAEGAGRPQLPVKKILTYNYLGEPVLTRESPGGGTGEARETTAEYDAAGRELRTQTTGGGTALARVPARTETSYNSAGAPYRQQFACLGTEKECAGFNRRATTTTYNALGEVTEYEDADGAKTKTTYDSYGRPVTVTDGKGTQVLHYDESSGVVTSMEVSGVGTFTARYDADGDLIERGLPDGLTAKTTYGPAGEAMKLSYTKTSSCGESCTWYEESLERSDEGQILAGKSSLVSDRYSYDKAGRLSEAQETPTGGTCTTRAYTFDADSNRLTKTTRSPGVGGACATTGGTTQKYEYDEADRLIGPAYDAWGRITSLPAEFAGGKALTTEYFANDMVASQTQNGVTNTFQLDATGRQRQREQTGGVAGVEVFHYDGPGDSPSWTSLGTTWSRDVSGIGGELAAVQESNGTTTFRLTDLHGDVVASASSSPTATKLLATSRFDEFGEPVAGSVGRFGWLGGRARRTEFASGVIQMGARSYVPQLGRFLTPDPIPGGSANPYDYANQDPINSFDLGGECAGPGTKKHKKCLGPPTPKSIRRADARINARTKRVASEHHFAAAGPSRACTAIACRVGWPHGGPGNSGFLESLAVKAANYVAHAVTGAPSAAAHFGAIFGQVGRDCGKAASEAWGEDTELRNAAGGEPELTAPLIFDSLVHAAASCMGGALE